MFNKLNVDVSKRVHILAEKQTVHCVSQYLSNSKRKLLHVMQPVCGTYLWHGGNMMPSGVPCLRPETHKSYARNDVKKHATTVNNRYNWLTN